MSVDDKDIILHVFLGTGGTRPEIVALRCDGLEVTHCAGLPTGHSVYAIDVNVESNMIITGTRAGRIDLLSWPSVIEDQAPQLIQSLEQGAPVLSVCWVDDSRIASADTAGRCLLWNPLIAPNTPILLEVKSECVCALLRLPSSQLLGLSCGGTLLFWDTNSGHLQRSVKGPPPPQISALVRLAYWPARDVVAYPAADGHLVLCEPNQPDPQLCIAHNKAFYVILISNNRLFTLGDGLMRVWDDKADAPVQQYQAPCGVVSGETLMSNPERFLLIDDSGKATICSIEAGELQQSEVLDGHEYRTVIAPSVRSRQAFVQEQKLVKARQIGAEIRENIASKRSEGTEQLHQKLVEMGFESVSLVLRAHGAEQQEDVAAELAARHRLSQRLSANVSRFRTSLHHYAAILERVWRLAEALQVYSQIGALQEGDERSRWLKASIEAMEGKDWIVEPGISCGVLIDSATVINKPFVGRWVLDTFEPISFREEGLTATGFTKKYEQIRAEDGRSGLPKATDKKLWWISRQTPRNIDTVILDASREKATDGLQLAIQFLDDGLQSILLPSILFDAGKLQGSSSSENNNEAVRHACQRLGQQELIGPWLHEMHRTVNLTLRRLRSEAIGHGRARRTHRD